MAANVILGRSRSMLANWKLLVMMTRGLPTSGSQQPPLGHGAGTGSGVRDIGGAWGEREAAMEEQYFRKLTAEQFEQLHKHHVDEIQYLEKEVTESMEAIERHKQKIVQLKKIAKDEK